MKALPPCPAHRATTALVAMSVLLACPILQAEEQPMRDNARSGVTWLTTCATDPANDARGTIPAEDFADLHDLGGLFFFSVHLPASCRVHLDLAGDAQSLELDQGDALFALVVNPEAATVPQWSVHSACPLTSLNLVLLSGSAAAYAEQDIHIYWQSLVAAETITRRDTDTFASSLPLTQTPLTPSSP